VHCHEINEIAESQEFHALISQTTSHLVVHVVWELEFLISCFFRAGSIAFLQLFRCRFRTDPFSNIVLVLLAKSIDIAFETSLHDLSAGGRTVLDCFFYLISGSLLDLGELFKLVSGICIVGALSRGVAENSEVLKFEYFLSEVEESGSEVGVEKEQSFFE
jgi:hypothetical protein